MGNNQRNYSYILRSFAFAKPYWKLLFATLIFNTLFSTFTALTVATTKPLFELVFSSTLSTEALPARATMLEKAKFYFYDFLKNLVLSKESLFNTLFNLGCFIVVLFLLKNFFKYLGSVTNAKLEESIIRSIRQKLFSKLLSLDLSFINQSKTGSLISTMTNDVNVVNSTTISAFTGLIREVIQIVLYLVLLLSISPFLTLIAFSSGIGTIFILRVATNFLRRYANRMQVAMADFTSILQETLSGFRIVKVYDLQKHLKNKFFDELRRYYRSAIKYQSVISLVPSINEIVAILALVVVFLVGGSKVLNGAMKPEDLMLFLFSLFSIMSPVGTAVHNISQFQRGYVSAKRIFDILDKSPEIVSGKIKIKNFQNEIEFRNVSFGYDSTMVVRNINFKIQKGKKIGIVGASGSGKSTLVDLLIRLYDPMEGKITIDGIDVREIDLQSYRSLFGIVSQEIILFNDTVENNIRFGKFEADESKIIEAAKISNSFDFISKLNNGFQTNIGERGVLLSGGEKQRIAIARALVRDPEIIIFDEATSALDSQSESVVQKAIEGSLFNRTAVIVAHRLSTVANCDNIIVLDNGEIVESGTHSDLIENRGIYYNLYTLQAINSNIATEGL